MSQSPLERDTDAASPQRASYEAGWVAIHRMIREGGSWSGRERDIAFLNTGDGAFAQVSAVTGLAFPDDGRAVASVDWDFDGDTDLWLANRTAPRLRLMINDSPTGSAANAFIGLRLQGKLQRDAIGARVEIKLGGALERTLVQTLRAGEGYLSQSSKLLNFGLGDARAIEALSVRWPDGTREEFSGTSPGGWYTLVEGSGRAVPWSLPAQASKLAPMPPELPAPTSVATIPLAARVPIPNLVFSDLKGAALTLENPRTPYVLLLWASWCAPCIGELREFVAAAKQLETSGVKVIAVSLDVPADRAKAAALLTSMNWPHASLYAGSESIDALDVLQQSLLERRRKLALPTSFLVDAQGQLAVMQRGPSSPARLCEQVSTLAGTALELRDRAVPFAGRWLGDPPVAPFGILESRFRERGLTRIADEYQRLGWKRIETSPAQLHYKIGIAREQAGRADLARAEFAQAVLLEPEFVEARMALAYMLQQAGDHAGAVEAYSIALRKAPKHQVALQNLIVSLVALNKRDLALERLEQLRAVNSSAAEQLDLRLKISKH